MWDNKSQRAFNELKKRFINILILIIFDPERQIVIKINISNYTIELYIS